MLAPFPTLITRRYTDGGEGSTLKDVCAFFTSGIVLSAFALPMVLARAGPTVSIHFSNPDEKDSRSFHVSNIIRILLESYQERLCNRGHVQNA